MSQADRPESARLAALASLENLVEPLVRALVVDDDESVSQFFTDVLSAEGYAVRSVLSGQAALDLLACESFDILLIDLVMPGMNGLELLRRIHACAPELPIILITGLADVDTARRALKEGASDVVTKPCNVRELPIILERNLTRQALARTRSQGHRRELQHSYEAVLSALLSALDTRDPETEGHSERVTAYTMEIADRMGVSGQELLHIERGALLHDIGKIGVPDRILLKPGPLTDEEWAQMKQHPIIGFRMCARIEMLRGAAPIVLHHHERWDGWGYPDGLAGDAIPLGARIFAVADTLDAMTTDRPYRKALLYSCAREEIAHNSGKQFDPRVVEAFLSIPESRWQAIRQRARR